DHVVDAPEDTEVPVRGLQGTVAGEVGPVVPVLAVSVPVVLGVVDIDEALGLPPDRLHDPWPGIPDANVACAAAARRDVVSVFVVDHREDAEGAGPATARLHGLQGGQGAAEEAAGLGLPPGIGDRRLALAYLGEVPAPHLRLDRLADGRHRLEVVTVLL